MMDKEAFFAAVAEGNAVEIKRLLDGGMDVNAKNGDRDTALMCAAAEGHTETAQLLLERGADVNAKNKCGWTALMGAAESGSTETARVLLERGADVNAKNGDRDTALMYAAAEGYTETAQLLLERGANVNAKNEYGDTALMWAARNGRTETVRLLLERGADVDAKNYFGTTALMKAAENWDAEIAHLLLERGADVNAKTDRGKTALMEAAERGDAEIAHLLLERGADVNAKNDYGETALMGAARNETALMMAERNKRAVVASRLIKNGAKIEGVDKAFLRKSMRESLSKIDAETVAAYCAAGIKPAPEDLRELSGGDFSLLEKHTVELAARVAAARVAGTEYSLPRGASTRNELSASERGAGALCDILRKHRLTERIDSVETAREAVLESVGKGGSPLPESPYYKAAEKYFSDVPYGDIVFEQLVKDVSATRKSTERSGRALGTNDWEPSL